MKKNSFYIVVYVYFSQFQKFESFQIFYILTKKTLVSLNNDLKGGHKFSNQCWPVYFLGQ